jgi:hypothetical protein
VAAVNEDSRGGQQRVRLDLQDALDLRPRQAADSCGGGIDTRKRTTAVREVQVSAPRGECNQAQYDGDDRKADYLGGT